MRHLVTLTILCLLCTAPVRGAELVVKKIAATLHPTLNLYNGQGVRTTQLASDHVFLVVQLWYDIKFKNKEDRLTLSSTDFKLADDQGNTSRRWAYYDLLGYANKTMSAYIDGRGDDDRGIGYQSFIYPVKKAAKSFTFTMGAITKTIRPVAATPRPKLNQLATVSISSAKLYDSISEVQRLWGGAKGIQTQRKTVWKTTAGRVLALTVRITGKKTNDATGRSLLLIHHNFALHTAKGDLTAYIGYRTGSSIYNSGSTRSYLVKGKWTPTEVTLFFQVPTDFRSFKLSYAGHPIASGAAKSGTPAKR